MGFLATINVPGYLPMDDDPPVFDTAQAAWQYLQDERERGEQEEPGDKWSDTWYTLRTLAGNTGRALTEYSDRFGNSDGQGTVYGPTPGYDGDHDLGLAYTVTIAEDAPDEDGQDVPDDFPVRVLGPDDPAKDRMTCGTCGRSWDDAVPTTWTPVPSGRCPFEYYH